MTRLLLAGGVAVVLAASLASPGRATHGTTVCAGALDYSMCIAIVDEIEARGDAQLLALFGLQNQIDGTSGGVALSEDNTNRLDLAWWGSWALVGLLLVAVVTPLFTRLLGERS